MGLSNKVLEYECVKNVKYQLVTRIFACEILK